MKLILLFLLTASLISWPAMPVEPVENESVQIIESKTAKQFDVYINGQLFTSYMYGDDQKKPIIHPLRTSRGTVVTRGFPLTKVPGERTDHPHHTSTWFNHGNLNGVDFWNNSGQRGSEKMGTIKHRAVRSLKNGKDRARLEVTMDWLMPDGSRILQEDDQIFFRVGQNLRIIDRVITLTAQDKKVVFNDNKDGGLGIRVARQLEEPATKPEIFTDAQGHPTTVAVMNNLGVAGVYLTSEGKVGEKEAWGTRAKWATLSGNIKGEDVVIGLFDHPKNSTYPAYWHARGYGLFTINPFGVKDFTKGEQTLNFTLQPGEKATFRFRILIHSGKLNKQQTEALYQQFLKEVTN